MGDKPPFDKFIQPDDGIIIHKGPGMDPNANLRDQEALIAELDRAIANKWPRETRRLSAQLTDLRQALYDWLRDGGFQPEWAKAPKASKFYGK